MKTFRFILLLGLAVLFCYIRFATFSPTTAPGPSIPSTPSTSQAETSNAVPDKVIDVLQTVRKTGQPPKGYVGGRVFQNREGRLPADGDYREFDVDPHQGNRNAERIIVEWKTKKAWYTADHYQTFTPLP